MQERLQKIIARAGIASRRHAEQLILSGQVRVNGKTIRELGRKTLRNLLRGMPERVYPVGNLEYSASGVVFLTNDGDFAADMLKHWENIEQVYHVKVKGMLMRQDLERLGKEIGAKLQTLRQPDATRGKTANFWYEVRMYSSKKEEMRKVLSKERHPVEKVKRVALGSLTVEGIPRGRYRLLSQKEADSFRKELSGGK